MTAKRTLDVFVIYDSEGDYVVGKDREEAIDAYGDEYGGNIPVRVISLQLRVPEIVDVEAEIDVPPGQARVVVK